MNEYHYEGFIVKELNYFDYKNLVKKLLTTDIEVINVIFNELFNSCLISDKKYNALDKFKLILFIRSLILGEDIQINYKKRNYNLDVTTILKDANIYEKDIETDCFVLNNFTSFYIKDIGEEIIKNLKILKINNKEINLEKFSFEEKQKIFNEITDVNIVDLYNQSLKDLKNNKIKFLDLDINLHNGDLLNVLKHIFNYDLNSLYDFEYSLMRHLNFTSNEFKNYSFSELKLFHNKLKDEMKEQNKDDNPGIPTQHK
tara:strand:+ start:112 stop:882 length:771 start_codon:yes stop_codon:yes gene_type:complete